MKNRFLIFLTAWLFFVLALPLAQAAENESTPPTAASDEQAAGAEEDDKLIFEPVSGEFDFESRDDRIVNLTHPTGIRATYRGDTLTAKRMSYNHDTGIIEAEGDVKLQRDGALWIGKKLSYNAQTRNIQGDFFKVGDTPFFAAGNNLTADVTNHVYTASEGMVTTDDVENPVYRIKAKTLIVFPGKRIVAYGATAYVGKLPVFYWPYYRRDYAERHPNNIELTPGYRSLYGPYILGAYNWHVSTNLNGSLNLDYRQKRGVGGGPDVNYDLGPLGKGLIKTYVTRDDDPRTNNLALPIDNFRHRLEFSHRATIRTNLSARAIVRWQSDEFFIRDFFETEYQNNPQPATFFEADQNWRNFNLNILAQPQVNDFFDTVERLPDIKLTGVRQQIGVTPLYYESESSLGYFRHQFANNAFPEFAAWRGDSFHQIVLPKTFGGWLNFTPRVGGRYTHYGEAEGSGIPFNEEGRFVFNTGAELSFKAARVFKSVKSQLLDMNEMRHILEPSINYVYVPSPSEIPPNLPQFDTAFPTFRLLPIEFPDLNSIDSIDSENTFRFGLRNKLQTKREDRVEDVLNSAVYVDWRAHRRPDQNSFSDIFTDLNFNPRTWLSANSQTRYDISAGVFQQSDNRLTYEPNNIWSLSVGHRYVRDIPTLGFDSGANAIYGTFYLRLNEDWGLRTQHLFEARDGRLEEQYYTVYRDLRSWTGALTLRARKARGGRDDLTVAVTFSLKAFPRFGVGDDKVSPSSLVGG